MADIADVMDVLQTIAVAAAYPGATGQSVLGPGKVDVGQGWPLSADVDKAMRAGRTLVSIYAVPSSSSDVPQPWMTEPGVIVAPVHGLTAAVNGQSFTLSGTPNANQYATAVIGAVGYSQLAVPGDTAATIAAGLAVQIAVDHPGTTSSGGAVTVPSGPDIVVRIGAPATLGERIHRQRIQFRIVVWSPNPADRAAVARAIDVALKRNLIVPLPDTSQALVTFQGTNLDDKYENNLVYRRDLIFNVVFDTVDEFPAYEVTSVETPLSVLP